MPKIRMYDWGRTRLRAGTIRLLHEHGAGLGLQLDLAERRIEMTHNLLKQAKQRLRLLRTEINALKIIDLDVFRHRLIDSSKHQIKIPEVHSDLHSVGE